VRCIQRSRLSRLASIDATVGLSLLTSSLLGGCWMDKSGDLPGRDQVVDPIRDADLRAHWPSAAGGASTQSPRPMIFPGDEQDPAAAPSGAAGVAAHAGSTGDDQAAAGSGTGIDINFDNADIQTVAKSLLGDSLGLNYAIDPRVQGLGHSHRHRRSSARTCCRSSRACSACSTPPCSAMET
jgi:general secretion pathway protein D